ncbi:hypothetical protein LEP3755_14180 [Leptolyngbya sp. NIES-3755]|nr:hypothetical protein LEP3755_14180 [Leptolyngbya sp. NIES-3755]
MEGIHQSPLAMFPATVKPIQLSGLGTSLFLMIAASLIFSPRARAIETVTLVFNESRTSVPFSDFRRFVETGETQRSTLQNFISRLPNTSQAIRTPFTREIAIPRPLSDRGFNNTIADFLLLQLSSALTVPDSLQPLRSALVASYRNNQSISMLEVISNYPIDDLVVQLPRVERAYNRVTAIAQRVPTALESNEFLFNLICSCPTSTAPMSQLPHREDGGACP